MVNVDVHFWGNPRQDLRSQRFFSLAGDLVRANVMISPDEFSGKGEETLTS
jgi:hypothetical protein